MPPVALRFLPPHSRFKQPQSKDPIPDRIIFHAEGTGTIKRQSIGAVLVGSILPPERRHRPGGSMTASATPGVLHPVAHIPVGIQRHYGFQRQIAVACQMAHKIIGAQLPIRVCAEVHQIVRPLIQQCLMLPDKCPIRQHGKQRRRQQQHIPALLNRHLPLRHGAVAVYLPVKNGIGAHIMGGKGERPALAGGKPEHRAQHALNQRRIVQQKHRHGGVADIHRSSAAIGEALLRDIQQLAVFIHHQLVRRRDLPE